MKTPSSSSRKWLWVAAAITLSAAYPCSVWMLRPLDRAANERHASSALKSLTSADADFRANDRDRNQVNDFWTGDVSGLYSTLGGEKHDQEVRLIDRAIALADARPLRPLAPAPVPYHGYFFIALDQDDSVENERERLYRTDTGGTPAMGKVHHLEKFGFSAYPAQYGVTGKFTFFINENNTVFRSDTGGKPMTHFPDDSMLMQIQSSSCPGEER